MHPSETHIPLRPDSFRPFTINLSASEVQEAATLAGLSGIPLSQIESTINQTFAETERGALAVLNDREMYLATRRTQLEERLTAKEEKLAEATNSLADSEEQWHKAEGDRKLAFAQFEYELEAANAEVRETDALITRDFWEQLRGAPVAASALPQGTEQKGLPSLDELGQSIYPTAGRTMPEIPLAIQVAAHDIRELNRQQGDIDKFLGDRLARGLSEPTLRLRIGVGYLLVAAIGVALTPLWDTIKPKAFLDQLLANIAKTLEGTPGWWILAIGLIGVPVVAGVAFLLR